MKTLHASKHLQITQLINTHIMYCNWIGPQSHQSVVQGEAAMLELLVQNQFTKVLNDNTQVTGPWNNAVTYTVETWFPAMITSGLQHFAWVFSPDIFAQLSARRAANVQNVVATFNEYHDAFNWLVKRE
jgi:hypothetical protein